MARLLVASVALLLAACGTPEPAAPSPAVSVPGQDVEELARPAVGEGPLSTEVLHALDSAWADFPEFAPDDLSVIGGSGDARLAWLLADSLRYLTTDEVLVATRAALAQLTGFEVTAPAGWVDAMDALMAWDVPAPPGYLEYKRRIFVALDERFEPFFTEASDVDYRFVVWGGVLIDDRPPEGDVPCSGCIPGLDHPHATMAEDGDWYPDERPVLGVVVGDEARAYPRNIMEVHELVNDTLGGREFALPYCTLCGSGQLYFTDDLPDPFTRPYLRTSGLLSRSNKVMYDVVTGSVFDTFTGRAVAGSMWQQGIELTQGSVVTTSWEAWKAAHPHTTIVDLDGGAGRHYSLDPLGDRDAYGPIFPVGDVDDRLPAQYSVLGVIGSDTVVAFPVGAVTAALAAGEVVEWGEIRVELDAGLLRASENGRDVVSHQAFWFAWSQFHPDTAVWSPPAP